jgi:hypothetical protein
MKSTKKVSKLISTKSMPAFGANSTQEAMIGGTGNTSAQAQNYKKGKGGK